MPKARANGIEIEYDTFGPIEAPAVLLIAGLGVPMIRWAPPFCEMLVARGFRVIRFDNRDVGLSTHLAGAPAPVPAEVMAARMRGERPDIPYTLDDMAEDAVGLLDALGIEKAHIVGRSMGGMIAQLVASAHPGRTLTMTSIMSSSGNPALPQATPEAMAALRAPAPDPFQDEEGYLTHCMRVARIFAGPGHPFDEAFQRAQALAEARRGWDPAGVARQFAAVVAAGDRRERLKTIVAPTLVVHGDSDPLIPLPSGQDTSANISGAELLVMKGMGHEIPPGMYEALAQAIARVAGRAARG